MVSIRRVVDLPAPFGPRKATSSPLADLQVEAADRLDRLLGAGEVPGQPPGPDHRSGLRVSRHGTTLGSASGQFLSAIGSSLEVMQHQRPDAAAALPAADPPLLARRRAGRPARGQPAHPAPRRRPAARARLPVDAVRGVAGGYQLRAGGSLPPLLLEDEEAVAIAVGLRTSAAGAVPGMEETSVQALTKVIVADAAAAAPADGRAASQTERRAVAAARPSTPPLLTTLAQACRDDEPLRFGYTARGAEPTDRGSSRTGWSRSAGAGTSSPTTATARTGARFRVDRIRDAAATGASASGRASCPPRTRSTFVQAGIRRDAAAVRRAGARSPTAPRSSRPSSAAGRPSSRARTAA